MKSKGNNGNLREYPFSDDKRKKQKIAKKTQKDQSII